MASGYGAAVRACAWRAAAVGAEEMASATIELVLSGLSAMALGAGMSDPLDIQRALDVQRNLDHCMANIKHASEAMADDMQAAAMRLGAAAMMLTSASHAVYKRAAQLTEGQAQLDTGEEQGSESR